jgi:adenylosuccinate synthase
MKQIAVIGLGFGDEGKGMVTSSLVNRYMSNKEYKNDEIIVVRYSGGHQAGHTINTVGIHHTFANFGSGTLQGVPTYWSPACTVDPVGLINEYKILFDKMNHHNDITLFINKNCPVTTPYDIDENREIEKINQHGSCGVGFGTTIEREEEGNVHFCFGDLFNSTIMEIKLNLVASYYLPDETPQMDWSGLEKFREAVQSITSSIFTFRPVDDLPAHFHTHIFEGSQGLLLDKDIGFFPHVTRANVGSKALPSLNEVFYVTRAYQTRHGNGPMSNEINLDLKNTENESNKKHKYQGAFRTGILDLDLLKYAIENDRKHSNAKKENLVITCMDQMKTFNLIVNSKLMESMSSDRFTRIIKNYLGIAGNLYLSWDIHSQII